MSDTLGRVVVFGMGAIGGAVAGALFRSGVVVEGIARGERLAAIAARGLRWRTEHHDERLPIPVQAAADVQAQPNDIVCIATKVTDVAAVLEHVRDTWGDVPIVCLCNGLHAEQHASAVMQRVIGSCVYVSASCPQPDETVLWGHPVPGWIHFGSIVGDCQSIVHGLASALSDGGIPTFVHDDIYPLKHTKWAYGQAGSAMALVADEWETVAHAANEEAVAILQANGLAMAHLRDLAPANYKTVAIDGRTRFGGSTAQSLLTGRPLETPYFTQPLLALAEQAQVSAPVNHALLLGAARAEQEGWRSPQLLASDVLDVYRTQTDRYVQATEHKSYNAGYERPATLHMMGEVAGLTVLDAGCGPGHHSAYLADRGARVFSFDRSSTMVQRAKQRVPNATVTIADLDAVLPYPTDSFDAVLCSLALHYAKDLRHTFGEFARVLRPNGRLVFSMHPPTEDCRVGEPARVQETWDLLGPVAVTFYNRHPSDVWHALGDAGFTVTDTPEPKPAAWVESVAPTAWAVLTARPVFLFVRCRLG